jgi:hypothetical protein
MKTKKKAHKRIFTIVWQFRVPARQRRAFERVYGPEGPWGQLFRMGKGYVSTELLRDRETAGRYLTTDRWESRSFCHSRSISEYKSLDDKCAKLTTSEALLGEFEG